MTYVCFESIKIFHATEILKKKIFLIFRHSFGAKFQNGLPEIITPSISPQNEYFEVVWITNGSIISYPLNTLFKPKTRNNRTICNNQTTQ